MDEERVLLLSALIKWSRSESMSSADLERLMGMISTAQLNVDSAQPDEIAGIQQRFQNVLRQRFFEQPQQ